MRLRIVAATAAAALAVFGLAGCKSNVGLAADINGTRVSESAVDDYITAQAQSVQVSTDSSGSNSYKVAPKSIVVQTLIDNQIYAQILNDSPAGKPTAGELAEARTQTLGGQTPSAFASSHGLKGFSAKFADAFAQREAYTALLTAEQSKGVNFQPIVAKLKLDITVSPRYGKWDPKTLSILSPNANSALPSFVSIAPQASSQ